MATEDIDIELETDLEVLLDSEIIIIVDLDG